MGAFPVSYTLNYSYGYLGFNAARNKSTRLWSLYSDGANNAGSTFHSGPNPLSQFQIGEELKQKKSIQYWYANSGGAAILSGRPEYGIGSYERDTPEQRKANSVELRRISSIRLL